MTAISKTCPTCFSVPRSMRISGEASPRVSILYTCGCRLAQELNSKAETVTPCPSYSLATLVEKQHSEMLKALDPQDKAIGDIFEDALARAKAQALDYVEGLKAPAGVSFLAPLVQGLENLLNPRVAAASQAFAAPYGTASTLTFSALWVGDWFSVLPTGKFTSLYMKVSSTQAQEFLYNGAPVLSAKVDQIWEGTKTFHQPPPALLTKAKDLLDGETFICVAPFAESTIYAKDGEYCTSLADKGYVIRSKTYPLNHNTDVLRCPLNPKAVDYKDLRLGRDYKLDPRSGTNYSASTLMTNRSLVYPLQGE